MHISKVIRISFAIIFSWVEEHIPSVIVVMLFEVCNHYISHLNIKSLYLDNCLHEKPIYRSRSRNRNRTWQNMAIWRLLKLATVYYLYTISLFIHLSKKIVVSLGQMGKNGLAIVVKNLPWTLKRQVQSEEGRFIILIFQAESEKNNSCFNLSFKW